MLFKYIYVITLAFCVAWLSVDQLHAQLAAPLSPSPPDMRNHAPEQPSAVDEQMEEARQKKLKEMRKEQMKRDTERLAALSNEVKDFVAKSDGNILSLDEIKKMDEIQKLARNIEQKMKE